MNFTVGEGEIVSLIGPNGAGKTTAFNVVTGFLDPTHGAVSYRGTALNGLKPHQIADLGLIRTFQRTSVFPNDTVYDNLLIGLHRQGRVGLLEAILGLPRARSSQRRLRERAGELVEWVGLERRAHDPRARCPTASSGLSEWRWRWRPSRRCCCSTSRFRA